MTWTMMCRSGACALVLFAPLFAAGCGLLDASDPTAIEEAELANATGADLLRREAVGQFYLSVGSGARAGGLLADEFLSDPLPGVLAAGTIPEEMQIDRREMLDKAAAGLYGNWHEVRRTAGSAITQLRTYGLEAVRQAYIGQMLAVRGYATLSLAEAFCPGFPLNEVVDGRVVYGPPLQIAAVFERALTDFDSALVYAADSGRIADGARLGRARALVGLGRFSEAAAAVEPVLTGYVWNMEFTTSGIFQGNPLAFTLSPHRVGVANREGGTGLDYISAADPRVKTTRVGLAYDNVTEIRAINKYPTFAAPIILASGVEARLIEAEAALRADQPQWLTILNTLRTNGNQNPDSSYQAGTGGVAGLAPLTDPGTAAARVDLLFRERAFWLFATGHRLGDLRRLVQHYGRDPGSVFPTGPYRLGNTYGASTSLLFPIAQEAAHNPMVTGCTGN